MTPFHSSRDKSFFGAGARRSMVELMLLLTAIAMAVSGVAALVYFRDGNVTRMSASIAALVCCAGFFWFGQKRSSALQDEADRRLQQLTAEDAARFLAAFRQTTESTTGVSIHRSQRIYVVTVAMMLVSAGLIGYGARSGVWQMAALGGVALCAYLLLLRKRMPQAEYLHIGPLGIKDPSRFGLIAWADIDSVSLGRLATEGGWIVTLDIAVRNPDTYLLDTGKGDWLTASLARIGTPPFNFPVQYCDVTPGEMLLIARHFHQRTLPGIPIVEASQGFKVDHLRAELNAASEEVEALTKKSQEIRESGAPEDPATARALEAGIARMKEVSDRIVESGELEVAKTNALMAGLKRNLAAALAIIGVAVVAFAIAIWWCVQIILR